MRTFLVAGNWKMNTTPAEGKMLARELKAELQAVLSAAKGTEVLVCPPFTGIAGVAGEITGSDIRLGAQNCNAEEKGAYTGEISAGMLKDLGCTHVIIGHSERRTLFAETDAIIAGKVISVLRSGLTVIFCVGETLMERETKQTAAVLDRQLRTVFDKINENDEVKSPAQIVIAYEPVWAIGTGKSASPAQAQEVHDFIRNIMKEYFGADSSSIKILYGGSVTAENAKQLFEEKDVDGALVGGASLKAGQFAGIVKAACEIL